MKIREALMYAENILARSSSPKIDAEVLLMLATRKNRAFLFSHMDSNLTKRQLVQYKNLITRRKRLEPVAYIVSEKEFYGRKFYLNKNVLIPRPETEHLVDETISAARFFITKNPIIIFEIGTGSGAVAITLAKEIPNAEIYASDISKKAIFIAKKNARQNNIQNIHFLLGNLLKPFSQKTADIIVANLPYLPYKSRDAELDFEPKTALYAGRNGTALYLAFLDEIANHTTPPGIVILEISNGTSRAISEYAKKILPAYRVRITKDYSENDRILLLKRDASS